MYSQFMMHGQKNIKCLNLYIKLLLYKNTRRLALGFTHVSC